MAPSRGRRCPARSPKARRHKPIIDFGEGPKAFAARVDGDVLVFLPGVGEIRRTRAMLED